MCDVSQLLKQSFFYDEHTQNASSENIDYPWVVFESKYQARTCIKHDIHSCSEKQALRYMPDGRLKRVQKIFLKYWKSLYKEHTEEFLLWKYLGGVSLKASTQSTDVFLMPQSLKAEVFSLLQLIV